MFESRVNPKSPIDGFIYPDDEEPIPKPNASQILPANFTHMLQQMFTSPYHDGTTSNQPPLVQPQDQNQNVVNTVTNQDLEGNLNHNQRQDPLQVIQAQA